jgi:hypothetical protein
MGKLPDAFPFSGRGSFVNTALVILLLASTPAQLPNNPSADTKAEAEEASAEARKLAAEYVVRFDKPEVMLRMEPEPVLRWTNHLGQRYYGDVYVWTHQGRPEVVASVNTIFNKTKYTYTEIQSLSTGRPVLSRGEKVVWQPAEAGVEWRRLPGAPKPGATAGARLLQMRTLAGQFTVVADYGIDKEQKEDLRLLSTPAYRYQSAEQGVLDGGLFAFTKGIDPDAFLMLEARGKKDDAEWEYALARFNGSCALRAALKDKTVWEVERLPRQTIWDPKQPYCNIRK